MICKTTFSTTLLILPEPIEVEGVLLWDGMPSGPTRESGEESKPTKKDSEKLTVAKVARNMPRSSREKHLKRRRC